MARLTGFLHPGADAAGAGFQAAQAKIALGSGGIFGVGIGNGVQKAFYLPEAHTDMISAVIGEELGLVGIVGVVGLFSMFGYAGLQVAKKAKDNYGKLLVAGLTSLILVQATINLFAVMGLAPLTGVPLPFVSYGNSSLLATLFAVGLILNVARGGTARAGKLRVVEGGRTPARGRSRSSSAKSAQEWWWRRGEPPVTSCRPWRSPPSFGLAAPRSPSSAPASGSRPSWCPPPATRSTSSRCAGSTAATRCARPAPRSRRWARSARRGGRSGAASADVVMGGGGFVAGPAGLARGARPHAARPHRGRQPPRPRQPPAGGPGAARLPRLPDRRPRGRALPGHRAAGARGGAARPTAPRPASASGSPAEARCLLVMGGSQGARSINRVRDRGLRRARGPRLPRRPPRRPARLRRAGASASPPRRTASATRCSPTSPTSATCLAACDLVARPLGRLDLRGDRGRAAGDPRPLPARDRRPPERQRRLDGARPARRP